ncbi:inositol 2-dehydrogenase [Hoeflea prorocentri]|uniref:Inositol 2-dehydrogenase n=1 Tax=Hoeflea prorocentri TaxID=1922333 RepID=A0A9X3UJV9_9HYPH|nr:inositol 2-dehydrogenase [Hoeflea prorocentri]MCY6382193.1 inositol 2-dehydrogenase [Hoeflea prorocentri]MDA5399993.1 inositol 2-dehydrogenase [Hoeflea prorocentri]
MLKTALIGCGRIGRMHAEIVNASSRTHLTLVHDVHGPSAASVAEASGARVAETAEAVFDDPDVDAVIVASVTSTHADYIEAAVRAGKPVLCEKPIDLDIRRVLACRDAIAGTDVPIQIGFNRRFDPGHTAVRDELASGDIGRLLQLLITSRDPAPPGDDYLRGAGGMIRDMTIHDFDLARYLLGDDEPVEVWACAQALIDPDLKQMDEVDCAMIVMRTGEGRQVLINNARQSPYGYDQRIEAMATGGMLQSTNRTPHGIARFTASGTDAGAPYLDFFIERYREAFVHQLNAFVDTVEKGTPASPSFEDGLKALRLAEAAYQSLETGKATRVET